MTGDFHPVRISTRDDHIEKYGHLYAGVKLSTWKVCSRCGFIHQNPRPSLEALSEFYMSGSYHAPELPADVARYMDFARWYFDEKVEFAIRQSRLSGGRVLEIGVGLGGALSLFKQRGWDTVGVEPDPVQAQFARETLGLTGVRQGLVDDSFDVDQKVDLVFSNHAFEHFADLEAIARAVVRVLRPGGFIFTAAPTCHANRSSLSKAWMNSSHYSLFTHNGLNQLFARHGLEEVAHTYRGWRKEIDDAWHVAQLTGKISDGSMYYENPAAVERDVNLYNPLRSALYAPIYAGYATRVALATRCAIVAQKLIREPRTVLRKALGRLTGTRRSG